MSNIINLVFFNGNVFIWNADDWLILRRNHRIIGELIGCLPKKPRQDLFLGLPLLLLPEEVTLLQEKGIAQIVKCSRLRQEPNDSLKKAFESYREQLFVEQEECLREERRKQVLMMMDRIVEGKRRKILGLDVGKKKIRKDLDDITRSKLESVHVNADELMKDEMSKLSKIEKTEALIQNHTVCPWLNEEDFKPMDWKYPTTREECLRYKTYKDLWEQGFYITSGDKFSGDFLVYPGDPIMFHSQFIVQCKNRDEEIPIMELVGQCRVATHVRKTQVYATLLEDGESIEYQSFQWAESTTIENG